MRERQEPCASAKWVHVRNSRAEAQVCGRKTPRVHVGKFAEVCVSMTSMEASGLEL